MRKTDFVKQCFAESVFIFLKEGVKMVIGGQPWIWYCLCGKECRDCEERIATCFTTLSKNQPIISSQR